MKSLEIANRKAPYFLVIMYIVGTAGHLVETTRPLMLGLTPFILLFLGLPVMTLAIALADPRKRYALIAWCAGTYVVTFAVEALGVATGKIFGDYSYGATLGTQVWNVPLVVGFNWVLVVAAGAAVSTRLTPHPVIGALLAGIITVAFDWVLEPVAIRLDYWDWSGGVIPLQNYAVWFVIAAATSLAFRLLDLCVRGWVLPIYGAIQLVFFLILRWGL